MVLALRAGYATAGNDTGHEGANGLFTLGHPEKVIDFAYRAMHEMTVQSKALIKAFYDQSPRLSYYNGCSTGGRQGLMAAQRYPEDFDAILAGAPANDHLYLHAGDMARMIDIFKDPEGLIPQAKQDSTGEGGHERLRCARRRERQPYYKPDGVQVRSGGPAMQVGRCRRLPDIEAGRNSEETLRRRKELERRVDLPRLRLWRRIRL